MTRKNAQSYLEPEHIHKIADAYDKFSIIEGFSNVATVEQVRKNNYSLGIPKYVAGVVEETEEEQNLDEAIDNWMRSSSSAQNEYEILNSLLLEGGETNV